MVVMMTMMLLVVMMMIGEQLWLIMITFNPTDADDDGG